MNEALTRHLLLPLHERLRRRTTIDYYAELCRQDHLPAAEVAGLREGKLAALLAHCRDRVPWYREIFRRHGLDSIEAPSRETLAELPILERDQIRAHGEEMIADGYHDRVLPANTGGSSGEPLVFQTDRIKEARHNAHKLHFRHWFGIQPGDRQVDFWGSPIEWGKQTRLRVWKDRYLLNQVILSAFNLSEARLDDHVQFLRAFQPRLIYGYPTVIDRVAQHVLERPGCLGSWRPRAIVCTSEMLHDHQRERIAGAFEAPVANEYGARDGGIIAHECGQGTLHLAAQQVWLEVDQPDADGVGDLLITNLDGWGMPLLRYRIGDRGSLATTKCPCGSPLPSLATLAGRSNDFLVGRDGRLVHSLGPIYVLRELANVRQFRLDQRADRSLSLSLVVTEPMNDEEIDALRRRLQAVLELDVPVEVQFTDTIEPEPSGKYRFVRSEALSA